jgi:hypothetical protein
VLVVEGDDAWERALFLPRVPKKRRHEREVGLDRRDKEGLEWWCRGRSFIGLAWCDEGDAHARLETHGLARPAYSHLSRFSLNVPNTHIEEIN